MTQEQMEHEDFLSWCQKFGQDPASEQARRMFKSAYDMGVDSVETFE
ncbi:hypothetical protein [Burkholderia ubonensis]|nr:hypothetical protein [Burkholderia ubonensis]